MSDSGVSVSGSGGGVVVVGSCSLCHHCGFMPEPGTCQSGRYDDGSSMDVNENDGGIGQCLLCNGGGVLTVALLLFLGFAIRAV
jgi:hypothetical protein